MKVKELMSDNPKSCKLASSLAEAAVLMWDNDCGVLPVVAEGEKVIGLVTDRDICMAAALKGRPLADITVADTITGKVFTCKPDDNVRTALKTMQENQVRRLPVVETDGTLKGLLSLNDVVLKAEEPKAKEALELSYADVVNTYRSICQHRSPTQQAQAAAGV